MITCYLVSTFNGESSCTYGIFDNLNSAKKYVVNLILHEYVDEPTIEFWQGTKRIKRIEHDKGKWTELK